MKTSTAVLTVLLALVPDILAAGSRAAWAEGGFPATTPLPETLERYYPPVAEQPIHLFKMLSLEASFSGIAADLMEGDIDGARGSFEEFRRHFREAAEMVPEWRNGYPVTEVEKLGAALAARDGSAGMKAVAAVGGVCHGCHRATMVAVQQKYRWGRMDSFTVKDPLTGAVTGYPRFKSLMAANMAGITVDLRQGQSGNARKQFDAFRARFRALGESCGGCHDATSRRYVDGDVRDALEKIEKVLSSGVPDSPAVTSLMRKIGSESCSKCHLVHVPAALAETVRK